MSRHHLKLTHAERMRLQIAAFALAYPMGWSRNQSTAFLEALTSSPWRHCRRSESEWILWKLGRRLNVIRGGCAPMEDEDDNVG